MPTPPIRWWRVLLPLMAASIGLWTSLVLRSYPIGSLCREGWGCEKVLSSSFAQVADIKLSDIGVAFYGFVAFALVGTVALKCCSFRRWIILVTLAICFFAATASLVLLVLQAFVIRSFCPLCCLSALCSGIVLAGVLLWRNVEPWAGFPMAACTLGLWPCFAALAVLFPGSLQQSDAVMAVVNGKAITESQMRQEVPLSLHPMEDALYEAKNAWLSERISELILQSEAERNGCSVESLLASRGSGSSGDRETQQAQQSKETSEEKVLGAEANKTDGAVEKAAKEALVDAVKHHHDVVIKLRRPLPPRIEFDLAEAPKVGDTNSPVRLVVFSDFECPFCVILAGRIRAAASEFPDVLVAFKFFPLLSHPRSLPAAIAATCAAREGKFWEYHDALFAAPDRRSDADFERMAIEVGINGDSFRKCYADPATRQNVLNDHSKAVTLGVNAVPSLFLNGILIGGVPQMQELRALLHRATTRK